MTIEKVVNKYKKLDSQPDKVWSNTKLDELRRKECLCLNCDRKNEDVPYSSCHVAAKLYELCLTYDMTLAITRCGASDDSGNLMYKPLPVVEKNA